MGKIKLAENILFYLGTLECLTDSDRIAFLFDEVGHSVYYSIAPSRGETFSISPVVQLIHGIYEVLPGLARGILRNRIYVRGSLTEMCRGMVRVVGKRVSDQWVGVDHGLSLSGIQFTRISSELWLPKGSTPFDLGLVLGEPGIKAGIRFDLKGRLESDRVSSHFDWMKVALSLCAQIPREVGPRYLSHRPVAALLVSEDHRILAWATNTHSCNRTLHAEINLIRHFLVNYGGCRLPSGSRIYTTLKPCKMCAGMIWEAAEDIRRLKVYYFEDDPGSFAKQTVLDSGSPERLRATKDPLLRRIQMEHLLAKPDVLRGASHF